MTDISGSSQAAPLLKLAALDAEDLAVVSAHLQEAIVEVSDMAYLPKERRFALLLGRFDWTLAPEGRRERCRSGLHFERVFRVRRSGFSQTADSVLTLLAITFLPGQAPSGTILLAFAQGAAISLEVECLEGALRDLGPRWPAEADPADPAETFDVSAVEA